MGVISKAVPLQNKGRVKILFRESTSIPIGKQFSEYTQFKVIVKEGKMVGMLSSKTRNSKG
jgi:hypothetical protein